MKILVVYGAKLIEFWKYNLTLEHAEHECCYVMGASIAVQVNMLGNFLEVNWPKNR